MLATAPGKLVLVGEYAVLEGATSLVMAVDRYARVTAKTDSSADAVRIIAPDVGVPETTVRRSAQPADAEVAKRLSLVLPKLAELPNVADLVLDTSGFFLGPDKMGLGSSAAVTVALAKLAKPDAEGQALFEIARTDHRRFQHGLGSGIDLAASVHGGVVRYQLTGDRAESRPLPWLKGLSFIAVWSGAPADTREFLKQVAQFAATEPNTYDALMSRCKAIAADACTAFERADVPAFLEMIDAYATALASLGRAARIPIVTPEHEHAAAIARSVGARYKPAGAGGGDLGTALCRTEDEAAVREALRAGGCTIVPLGLAEHGARLETI
jgi:phosphomevalonate kinase